MRKAQQAVRALPYQEEPDFARDFEKHARWYGWDFYHTYDSYRSRPGFPDYVLWRRDRTLFVELKTDRPSSHSDDDQKYCQRTLAGNPHVEVYEWRPRDWQRIVRVLR